MDYIIVLESIEGWLECFLEYYIEFINMFRKKELKKDIEFRVIYKLD